MQGIIYQEFLPAAWTVHAACSPTRSSLPTHAVRNLIRESQIHMLENTIQTGPQRGHDC
jgi:Tfp pilus assembly pilus retraction ATPase PilT